MTAVAVFSPTRTDDGRKGKVFSIRISDTDRALLAKGAAEADMPWSYERRRGSIGGFVVWAALQWIQTSKMKPGADPPTRRRKKGRRAATSRRVVPGRRRRGTTKLQARKGRGKRGRK